MIDLTTLENALDSPKMGRLGQLNVASFLSKRCAKPS